MIRCLILLLLPAFASGQAVRDYLRHTARNWPTYALSLSAGYADGTADALQHHYSRSVFKRARNQQYFDPAISWQNKYADWPTNQSAAYPGAKTWLVWTTDAWHLSKTVRSKCIQITPFIYKAEKGRTERKRWWVIADFALASLTFSAGWHLADVTLTN